MILAVLASWIASPPEAAKPAPRLRYVVDLPAGDNVRALVEMAKCVLRERAAACAPNGSMRAALLMLASGRVEEVQP